MNLTVIEAFEIVLSLAKQGMIDEPDMPKEFERQKEAIAIVEDIAVNNYGDDE